MKTFIIIALLALIASWFSQSASAEAVIPEPTNQQITAFDTSTKENRLSFIMLATAASGITLALFSEKEDEN